MVKWRSERQWGSSREQELKMKVTIFKELNNFPTMENVDFVHIQNVH